MLEWRSRSALDVAETSSTYLDDDDDGPKPHELYGKFTWKIENFSEISKRELRSNVFDVGSYKWYILVYPQGCDVCNHLSLFLCVADYDKLLPGWSHFAQFTIAVVNKDPKKSKYSDTLHRFCKKEHDWGWKKFMELSKVLDGFTVADTLVIKAQVQVILDKPSKPFRCLDPQYRRELVRVYLTNVEGICRRFCDDKKTRLSWVRDEAHSFRHFWALLAPEQQRKLLTDKGEVILKAVVKQFFNEKEVTSTLVMDALYSGCKQIEEHSRSFLEGKCSSDNAPVVLVKAERNTFTLFGDLMEIADRVQRDFIPAAKDDSKVLQPNDGLTLRSGQEGDDYRRDSIERDEKRLAELGRKTVEMFVIAHIFCEKLEIAYREAEALKRQDQLIAEEFEMARLEESKAQAKALADKERKAKKKEKMKLRKEAEKIKREAEEAERKAREEARRLEADRRAKEAEKKRLEDGQPNPSQQQPHARKGAKGREDKRQLAAQQQQAAQAQAQQGKGKVSQAGWGSAAQQQQQAALAGYGRASAAAPADGPAADPAGALPTLSSLAAAVVAESAEAATVAAAGQAERPDSRAEAHDGGGSSSGDDEVGTVNQATGVAESSGDAEDEVDAGAEGSAAGAAAGPLSESDGESEGRAALEEEVTILRAQVVQLQKLLAEKDAEMFALRAQLAELQPTEIADMVRDGAASTSSAAHVMPARAASGSSSSNALAMADGGAAAAPSNGSSAVARDAGPSAAAEGAAGAASAAGAVDRGAKLESPTANGPSVVRSEVTSPSSIPAAAAAAAAAAVRRMQPLSAAASGPQPSGHEAVPLMHAGAAPARPSSTGPSLPAAVAAASTMRAVPGASSAAHHPQAAAAPSSEGHAAPAAGGIMQRSTSATLPGAVASGSAAGPGPYTQLGPHQLAAAAAAVAASANGRPRQAQSQAMDGASAASSAPAASGAKPAPYMPPATAGAVASSIAATANGIGGVHGAAAAQAVQDGLPSYRNAAAGVLAPGQSASGAPAMASSGATAASSLVGSLMPVSPSAQSGTASAGAAAHKRVDEGAPAAVGAAAAVAARHISHTVGSADGAFSATSARIMMQQAQRQGLAFSTPTAVQSKQRNSNQMDSPGLEDFAHINMIDDLLTE